MANRYRQPESRIEVEFRALVKEGREWLTQADYHQLVASVFQYVRAPRDVSELSVTLVGPRRMEQLAWRLGKRGPTDVLSFTLDPPFLGEIFLCPEEIKRRAHLFERTPREHAEHLFVHGMLHLLGYDHKTTRGARRMEEMERKIVRSK